MPELVWIYSVAACAIMGVVTVALALDRRRWQTLAESRWLFIQDCKRAAETPPDMCFGPTFLRIKHFELLDLRSDKRTLLEALAAMEERCDYHAGRAKSVIGQARRWARIAAAQRVTIREQAALLANDPERIQDNNAVEIVDSLREIGMGLGLRNWRDAPIWCFKAATLIEAKLLRCPESEEATDR